MRQIQCDHTTLIGFIHDKRRYKSLLSCPQLTYSIIHYRPRSITYITNIITIYLKADWEGGVCTLIHNHMINHSLYPEFQSSYRQNHSMETALVKVTNDIVMKMNSQQMTLLVILDLSAAFDTVNHNILLTRLNEEIGICGSFALEWFKSYLANRGLWVSINESLSEHFSLDCGVPQGLYLGPLLFIMYASQLFKVVEDQLHALLHGRHADLSEF